MIDGVGSGAAVGGGGGGHDGFLILRRCRGIYLVGVAYIDSYSQSFWSSVLPGIIFLAMSGVREMLPPVLALNLLFSPSQIVEQLI